MKEVQKATEASENGDLDLLDVVQQRILSHNGTGSDEESGNDTEEGRASDEKRKLLVKGSVVEEKKRPPVATTNRSSTKTAPSTMEKRQIAPKVSSVERHELSESETTANELDLLRIVEDRILSGPAPKSNLEDHKASGLTSAPPSSAMKEAGYITKTQELEKMISEGTYSAASFAPRGAAAGDGQAGVVRADPEAEVQPGAYALGGIDSSGRAVERQQELPGQERIQGRDLEVGVDSGLAIADPVNQEETIPTAVPHGEGDKDDKSQSRQGLIGLACVGVLLAIVVVVVVVLRSTRSSSESEDSTTLPPTPSPTSLISAKESFLQHILPKYTLGSIDIGTDRPSSQTLAYEWMIEDPKLLEYEDHRARQRYALATLYFATRGDEWYGKEGWLNHSLHECNWFMHPAFAEEENGLLYHDPILNYEMQRFNPCHDHLDSANTTETMAGIGDGLYKHLWLRGNNLQGSLPDEIYDFLPELRSISLFANSFYETTLSSKIGLLPHLEALNLASSGLTGTIPSTLGLLPLTNLILFRNHITGDIPVELGALTDLKTLLMDATDFTGSLPTELGNLALLEALNFDQSYISGQLPSELGRLRHLEELYVDFTYLTGTLRK